MTGVGFKDCKLALDDSNGDIEKSIEIGSAAAAIVVTKVGCSPAMPNLEEILDVKDDKPLPRYIVGNDASMFLEAKKGKTDIEFENYMKKELYGE